MTKGMEHTDNCPFQDLDITDDEMGRIKRAFMDKEFRKLFADYVDEISDPENRRIYEEELTQLEAERGIEIKFIHPSPGFVVKTICDGKHKTFINVAQCELINRPTSRCDRNASGRTGLTWSLPFSQSPVRKDFDCEKSICLVYDVVFHPDTLHLATKDAQFKAMVVRTALEAVRDTFAVDLDMVNLKVPKLKYKGTPRSTVVRKRMPFAGNPEPSPLDGIYPPVPEKKTTKAATTTTTTNGNNANNGNKPAKPKTAKKKPPPSCPASAVFDRPDDSYTTPKYTLVQRQHVDYASMTHELDAKIDVTVPHELVLTIDLPLLRSAGDAAVHVMSDAVFVSSERPAKYRLGVSLPYEVCEVRGKGCFNQEQRQLVITLPVLRAAMTVRQICGDDPVTVVEQGSPERSHCMEVVQSNSDSNDTDGSTTSETPDHSEPATAAPSSFLDRSILYNLPPFDCENLGKALLFTLHVRNVDPSTLAYDQQPHSVHLRFESLGTGYFPQYYAFYLRLPSTHACTVRSVQPDVWDNDVIVQLELVTGDTSSVEYYEAGLDASALRRFECERPSEDVFEDAEDGDTFAMDTIAAALPTVSFSPQKQLKQRSYSESNCDDFHDADMDIHGDGGEDDEDDDEDHDYGALASSNNNNNGPSTKDRTYSECSADDGGVQGNRGKCLKGILKRRSSSMLSESQSSFDEPCSRSVEMAGSEHSKKSVRFDNNIRKLLFRLNSTVAGQRKPKANKRKKKKRCTERRYSEGEASDYDPKSSSGGAGGAQQPQRNAAIGQKTASANGQQNLHDSGVDLHFKNGMIFELDM